MIMQMMVLFNQISFAKPNRDHSCAKFMSTNTMKDILEREISGDLKDLSAASK